MALSALYFWYFSTLGIILAFFNLYAKHLGLVQATPDQTTYVTLPH